MSIILDRIDTVPVMDEQFSYPYRQWLAVLVDTLNEIANDVQEALNLLTAQSYTAVEIADMFTAGDLTNGVLLYDTDNNVYVGMQNGALVKFTTSAYP